jgi:hypothetical protein
MILFWGPRRYNEGLGNVTPHDLHTEEHLEIIRSRKEVKSKTLAACIIRPAWSGGMALKYPILLMAQLFISADYI